MLWWELREFIKNWGRIPSTDNRFPLYQKFISEITSPKLPPPGSEGKTVMESKTSMKARRIKSPNLADAACLTFGTAMDAPAFSFVL
jgi:hypothetical protein